MNSTKESTPRHKEGEIRSIQTFNARRGKSIVHLGGINERRKREEHVLGAQHVPVVRYAGNVAEVCWNKGVSQVTY